MDSPSHLAERAVSLEQSLAFSLEAEALALSEGEKAHRLALSRQGVRRIPNKKVRLFEGMEYVGTFVGEVDDRDVPNGRGVFHETEGFAVGQGIFGGGGGNRVENGVRYQGQWEGGMPSGYGLLEQGAGAPRALYAGRMVNGMKDGYGVQRSAGGPDGQSIFYRGEYALGRASGFGLREAQGSLAGHKITPAPLKAGSTTTAKGIKGGSWAHGYPILVHTPAVPALPEKKTEKKGAKGKKSSPGTEN